MVVDIHSHVLPGIDDGSKSLAESIALLKMEAEQGVTHVVATPHFYARYDRPETYFAQRKEAYLRLTEEMEKHGGLPRLSLGAEVLYFSGISQSDILDELTIDGGKYILIEMEQMPWQESVYRELEDIYRNRGLVPIIAHVERYLPRFRAGKHLGRFLELPVLIQCNAGFFLEKGSRRMALRMLRRGQIHLLGSDCHSVAHRPPKLGSAVELIRKELGQELLDTIEANERMIFGKE